jgi:hypothetical protein
MLLFPLIVLGCNDPYVARAMEHDQASMRFALDSYAASETRRPADLRNISQIIGAQFCDDVETLPRSISGVEAFFRKDVEDWPRHEADIRQEARHQFEGDLATILWTLPRLAF